MSTQAEITALSLHEILLSISDSLNEAQQQLRNMPPYDEYGRPNTLYQLPYLDFSLEVISEVSQFTSPTALPNAIGVSNKHSIQQIQPSYQKIIFAPVKVNNQSINQSSNKITSTISGRFVAILPNEGLPQVFISVTNEPIQGTSKVKLTVQLNYATMDPVIGQKVEVNFDLETSLALSETTSLGANPIFSPVKEGFTDNTGTFKTEVNFAGALSNETYVLVANSGSIFKSIAITK